MAGLTIGTATSAKQGTLGTGTNADYQPLSATISAPTRIASFDLSTQPTINPNNVYTTGGGTNGTGTKSAGLTYTDPYAQWGGQSAYNNLVNGFNNQKGNIYSSATDAAHNSGLGLQGSILDLIDSIRNGQSAIDNKGINNELAKQRGVADIYGGISRGISSAGVTLGNRNASDSSAAEAIARAYGQQGQHQMSSVGNQYEMGNRDIALAQTDLDSQRASGVRHIQTSEDQAANSIVSDANNKLAALDAAMANASLPDRIALDAEKTKIRGQVLAELGKYDNQLGDVNNINAMDQNGRISEATRLGALGTAPASAFNYTAQVPTQLQGTGPVPSELPIFTFSRKNQQ